MDNDRLVPVLTAGNPALLAVAKSMLDDAGIRYMTSGEGFQALYAAGPVAILVFEIDADRARELFANL